MAVKLCECGEELFNASQCYGCWRESNAWTPSPAEIEAMKLQIRRENGHDPKQPRLFTAARG